MSGKHDGAASITGTLLNPATEGVTVAAFLTAGFPTRAGFRRCARRLVEEIDLLEIGVPFSDPMADGVTVQRASRKALHNGVTLTAILEEVADLALPVPTVLMSYLNPLLAFGLEELVERCSTSGIDGLIVPDLPLEATASLLEMCDASGVALIQLVTPTSSRSRIAKLCAASRGFVYAVATTGITGGEADAWETLSEYLRSVREASELPVLAGFGVRSTGQVAAIADLVHGVVVGSALMEAIERGEDPGDFIRGLITRPEPTGNKS